jgi:hypothetical protein
VINTTAKKQSFDDDVMHEMGEGPGEDEDYSVESEDEEEGGDEEAHGDRIMAVKKLGKALGIEIAEPEAAAEALKMFIDSCY